MRAGSIIVMRDGVACTCVYALTFRVMIVHTCAYCFPKLLCAGVRSLMSHLCE